jgi:hypothetical protein
MGLTPGSGEWAGWWAVDRPDKRVLEYLRRSIPPLYRQFDDKHVKWYVHQKYVEFVKQLMQQTTVTPSSDDPWAVLHLRPGAPPAIIKAVWREMAKELHPDRGGDEEQFKRVKAAYDKLMKE